MKISHIGGVADGESVELHDNVLSGQQLFKRSTDFPSDHIRQHDYIRHRFELRGDDGQIEHRELMVWDGLTREEAAALVGARFQRTVTSQTPHL